MSDSPAKVIRAVTLTGIVIGCVGSIAAQSTGELVAKNVAARGGLDNIKAITSIRMSGKLETQGTVIQYFADTKPDSIVRESQTLQGMTRIHAYDGSEAWQIDPFAGRRDAERMGEDDTRDLIEQYDFYRPLVDYQRKGSKIEYLGHFPVDGDDALLLKVTLRNGDIVKCYLDPDTYLEIRSERLMFVRGKVHQTFTNLGSYKMVNGVYFPFSIESGTPGDPANNVKLTLSKIEANVPMPDSEFKMPANKGTRESLDR
jgi:hypothetical protein